MFVASHGMVETELQPMDKPDHFTGFDIYAVHCERDTAGRVVALLLAPRSQYFCFCRLAGAHSSLRGLAQSTLAASRIC